MLGRLANHIQRFSCSAGNWRSEIKYRVEAFQTNPVVRCLVHRSDGRSRKIPDTAERRERCSGGEGAEDVPGLPRRVESRTD